MPNPAKQIPIHKAPSDNPDMPIGTRVMDYYIGGRVQMHDNFTFDDKLKVVAFRRGRSSAKIIVEGSTGKYEMFLVDFINVMTSVGWPKRGRTGAWTWCKRGTNYGLYRVGAEGERP